MERAGIRDYTLPGYAESWVGRRIRLDVAGNIFPATVGRHLHHLYRCSMTMSEDIDPTVLRSAWAATAGRFPSIVAGLRVGIGWFTLTPVEVPKVERENGRFLRHMSKKELRRCCLRVMYEGGEMILEFFHGLCDGYAAMIFLKSLAAEYIEQRYQTTIPNTFGVTSREDAPSPYELEDSFLEHTGTEGGPRNKRRAFSLDGEPLPNGRLKGTTLVTDVKCALSCARAQGVSLTEYLVAVMILSVLKLREESPKKQRGKPVLISVPVNLRRMFASQSLRNFSLSAIAGAEDGCGDVTLSEVCAAVHSQLASQITVENMTAGITNNVKITVSPIFACLPLLLKVLAMRVAYLILGTNSCTLSVSNLGLIELPEKMRPYVLDVNCCMDANLFSTNSCAVLSHKGRLNINLCRSIKSDRLETIFAEQLRACGMQVEKRG